MPILRTSRVCVCVTLRLCFNCLFVYLLQVKQGIRCNCVCPARIHTPFVVMTRPQLRRELKASPMLLAHCNHRMRTSQRTTLGRSAACSRNCQSTSPLAAWGNPGGRSTHALLFVNAKPPDLSLNIHLLHVCACVPTARLRRSLPFCCHARPPL